ncbi:MAG: TrkA family potassium uptake protein [Candidatus Omnitrophota bacterium]
MRRFAIIGLGRFGSSVARTLGEKGQQVIAIDKNEELVHDIMDNVTKAICLDATDEKAVKAAGLQDIEVAVCAIGTDVEASVLITLLLKDLGIPTVVCKAVNQAHKKVLEKIGATRVVLPEMEMGARIANTLISSSDKVMEHIDVSDISSIIEIKPPEEFIGKSLRELKVRAEYGVNVIAVKKKVRTTKNGEPCETEKIEITPQADDVITKDDILVVFGANEKIEALKKKK